MMLSSSAFEHGQNTFGLALSLSLMNSTCIAFCM